MQELCQIFIVSRPWNNFIVKSERSHLQGQLLQHDHIGEGIHQKDIQEL